MSSLGWWEEGARTKTPQTHPRSSTGGRSPLALIFTPPECTRGWEAPSGRDPAAGVAGCCYQGEQGLFIDSGTEPPPPAGSHGPPRQTLALWVPVTSQSPGDRDQAGAHTLTHIPLPSPHTP